MKKVCFLLILGLILAVFSANAEAGISSVGADTLVKVGIMEYERGNIDTAIHEFSKALMINPGNEKAKKWLNKCGLKNGIYSGQKTVLSKTVELEQKLVEYENDISELNMDNVVKGDQIKTLQLEKDVLVQTNKDKSEKLYSLMQEVSKLKHEAVSNKRMQNNRRVIEEGLMSDKSIQEKYDVVLNQAYNYEKELQKLERQYNHLKNRHIYQYVHQDKLIHVLEDYLHLRENEVNDAKDRLLIKEIAITKSIKRLLSRLDEMLEMKDSIDKYSSRVSDIDQKENKMDTLKSLKFKLQDAFSELAKIEGSSSEKEQKMVQIEQKVQETEAQIAMLLNSEKLLN